MRRVSADIWKAAYSRCIVVALAATMLGACAGGPDIRSSASPFADFSQYQTFGFMTPLGTDRDGSRTLLSAQLIVVTTRELEARGLTLVGDKPDLLVNFITSTQTGIQTLNQPVSMSALRGYGAWNGYPGRASTLGSITEGSLGIDLVDRRSNQLVWEAAATDRVTEAMRDNLDAVLDEVVGLIFAEFPARD